MAKDIVVLGLGNMLMSDEGIGVYIVERLQKQAAKFPECRIHRCRNRRHERSAS